MMTDKEIVDRLIDRDEAVTADFFFRRCRPLFLSIIRFVFSYPVDLDEFVNELYLYLMKNDAAKLRSFKGESSIYQWLKVVAIRYFIDKRDRMIDDRSKDALYEGKNDVPVDTVSRGEARRDFMGVLSDMSNKRYAEVLQFLIAEDMEPQKLADRMGVTVDNLYNIKKRAIASFTEEINNDLEAYGKE
jgi:RNA polymerase sigma factor (sigma-70 family)